MNDNDQKQERLFTRSEVEDACRITSRATAHAFVSTGARPGAALDEVGELQCDEYWYQMIHFNRPGVESRPRLVADREVAPVDTLIQQALLEEMGLTNA